MLQLVYGLCLGIRLLENDADFACAIFILNRSNWKNKSFYDVIFVRTIVTDDTGHIRTL